MKTFTPFTPVPASPADAATLTRRAAVLGLAVLPLALRAQPDYPNKPIKIVVPYAPGGSADVLGRLAGRLLSDALAQTVVVENRAGAGGVIGSQQVAKSPADGYTLVVSGIGSHVIASASTATAFDGLRDFSHIALLGGPPLALVVNAALPVRDVKGFIGYTAGRPDGISWGSPGQGTHGHLAGELFRAATKLNMVHVSYKGAGPAVSDLLGNQIPAAFMTLSSANAHVDSGKLRLLAVSSTRRLPRYPDVPTFAELGFPEITGTTWFALSGPPGMPLAVVRRLNAELVRGLQSDEGKRMLASESMETTGYDAAAFTRFVASEIERWAPAVRMLAAPASR